MAVKDGILAEKGGFGGDGGGKSRVIWSEKWFWRLFWGDLEKKS